MQYSEAIKVIRDQNITAVKITDTAGNKVIDFLDEESAENLISVLDSYKPMLASYGRLDFVAATSEVRRANFKGAYRWKIVFSDAITGAVKQDFTQAGKIPSGYISEREAALMAELQALKLRMDMDAKLKALEAKLEGKTKKSDGFDKYLPMLAFIPGFKFDEGSIMNAMRLSQIQGMMNGSMNMQQTGINGINGQQQLSVQMTAEEKELLVKIEVELDKLSQKTSLQNIHKLIEGLNANPQFIEMALGFINQKNG